MAYGTVGANLELGRGPGLSGMIRKILSANSTGGYRRRFAPKGFRGPILIKRSATAPTTDNADDDPGSVGQYVLHINSATGAVALYQCTAYTSSSSFTMSACNGVSATLAGINA